MQIADSTNFQLSFCASLLLLCKTTMYHVPNFSPIPPLLRRIDGAGAFLLCGRKKAALLFPLKAGVPFTAVIMVPDYCYLPLALV